MVNKLIIGLTMIAQTVAMAGNQVPAGVITLSDEPRLSQNIFLVDKTARTLSVFNWVDGKLHLHDTQAADIGKKTGAKTKENDHRTPEGIYFLLQRKTQPEIPFDLYGNLAFTTDYPNIFDTRDQKTGNGIWLHAVPDSVPMTRGSRGCVVVRNDSIKQLEPIIKLNQTPILIYDKIPWISEEEWTTQRKTHLDFIEEWRTAWQNQDVDNYIKFYDESFNSGPQSGNMNLKQWYKHKKSLKEQYSFIKVELGSPLILRNQDQVVIRVMQKYQSDKHQDYGEKTIHAKYDPKTGFKIIRENWLKVAPENDKSGVNTVLTETHSQKSP